MSTIQRTQSQLRRRGGGRVAAALSGVLLIAALAGCSATGDAAAELPGDFPKAVQMADGTVTAAAKADGAWTASVKLDQDATRQQAIEELTSNGFAIVGESGTHGNDRVYSLASDTYSVRVGVTTVDGNDVLNYTVAKRQTAAE
ncbi:hypothetical protein D3228_13940 [Leucobacter luti]|nr:hypothetical protein [Leucobacter luti]